MKSFSYIIFMRKQNLYRMKIFLGLKSNFLREIKCNILELNKYSLIVTSKKHEHIETFMSPHLYQFNYSYRVVVSKLIIYLDQ